MKSSFIPYLILLLWMTGCNKERPSETLSLPSNLEVTGIARDDGSGKVDFTVSADNANFYTIFYGDTPGQKGHVINTGKAEHRYGQSGVYTIRVQANTTSEYHISKTINVYVLLKADMDIYFPTEGVTSPESYGGKTLMWSDEFEGNDLNPDNWKHETGNGEGGWGNKELQYYRPNNTELKNGHLIIKADNQAFGGFDYTSSRITTKDLQSFKYGRIDIRAVMPEGQGMWPALWMLGSNFDDVGWTKCGEIDIMEMKSKDNKVVHGTVHWFDDVKEKDANKTAKTTVVHGLDKRFHVYSIEWTKEKIVWFVDNEKYHEVDITVNELSEFQKEFFIIFNVAVGGKWPGDPDDTTIFPQYMLVDYIRVFQ